MRSYKDIFKYSITLFTLLSVLAACSPFQKVGTIVRGTPDVGNGTPAVMPPVYATPPPAEKAPVTATGSTYAFVRNRQLMVELNGSAVQQVTRFTYTDLPNVFWQTPIWSKGDQFLAFIMNARTSGLGGGGCPGPDDQAGSLYVLNPKTSQLAQITLPRVQTHLQVNAQPHPDNWKYASWEDATHLLAWYNGDGVNTGNMAGLYRYDVNTQAIALVIPLQSIGAQSDADVKRGMPFILSVRFRNGQLFYEAVTHPYEQQSQIALYTHSVLKPDQQSSKVLDVGSEAWCSMRADSAYIFPAWDVSPDGEQVATQTILGSVQTVHITDGSTTRLFSDIPARVLSRDVQLTWAPDNQTVVLSQNGSTLAQDGLYSTSLANPVLTQRYTPTLTGQVTWRPDSAGFVLQSEQGTQPESGNSSLPQNVYVFAKGDTHGRLLIADARAFAWG
ncbi:MAG: hypothetical protein NVS2B12_00950 [Ktedonobacteraceae bacterium]